MSILIKGTIGDEDTNEDDMDAPPPHIPLPNVSKDILEKIIAFCHHHQTEPMTAIASPLKSHKIKDLVQDWYSDFVNLDMDTLVSLVAAANYLDIKELLDLTSLAVCILIKAKSGSELRELFHITDDDLTEEERAQIQRDNDTADRGPSPTEINNNMNDAPAAMEL